MDKIGQKFNSFEEAELAEDEYYKKLSPNERVAILLELVAQYRATLGGAGEKFERVFRVMPLGKS